MYSTNINIIGSIPDLNLIMDVLSEISKGKATRDVFNKILDGDIYAIRTNKARTRFLKAIKAVFLKFKSDDHRIVFFSLFKYQSLQNQKRSALFCQFGINDLLFYELTCNVLVPLYLSGRLTINKAEFVSYLYDLRDKKTDVRSWSDSTIQIIATKYLTLLKKLDLIKGRTKKEFLNINLEDETIIYIIYMLHSLKGREINLQKNPYTPFLMLDHKNLIDRVKKISIDDFFSLTTLGNDIKIDLTYPYEEIVNVIAKRYQSKI